MDKWKIKKHEDSVPKKILFGDSQNAMVYTLFTRKDGMKKFSVKKYIIGPQGRISEHIHPWEHFFYILAGSGTIQESSQHDIQTHIASPGKAFYLPAYFKHQLINSSLMKPLIFLSVLPCEFDVVEEKYECY